MMVWVRPLLSPWTITEANSPGLTLSETSEVAPFALKVPLMSLLARIGKKPVAGFADVSAIFACEPAAVRSTGSAEAATKRTNDESSAGPVSYSLMSAA